MSRPKLGPLSQERLVHELRAVIDTARFAPRGSVTEVDAINRLVELVRDHRVSALRSHVLHNLGCRRRTWLRQLAATMPRGADSALIEQMGCGNR